MNTNVSKTTMDQLTEKDVGVKTAGKTNEPPTPLLLLDRPMPLPKFVWSSENYTNSDNNQLCKFLDRYTGSCSISTIYEAFDELTDLGAILSVDFHSNVFTFNSRRLFALGYVVVFDMRKRSPVFVKCHQLSYIYDIRPYVTPVVPFTVLESYCLIKIKRGGSY